MKNLFKILSLSFLLAISAQSMQPGGPLLPQEILKKNKENKLTETEVAFNALSFSKILEKNSEDAANGFGCQSLQEIEDLVNPLLKEIQEIFENADNAKLRKLPGLEIEKETYEAIEDECEREAMQSKDEGALNGFITMVENPVKFESQGQSKRDLYLVFKAAVVLHAGLQVYEKTRGYEVLYGYKIASSNAGPKIRAILGQLSARLLGAFHSDPLSQGGGWGKNITERINQAYQKLFNKDTSFLNFLKEAQKANEFQVLGSEEIEEIEEIKEIKEIKEIEEIEEI